MASSECETDEISLTITDTIINCNYKNLKKILYIRDLSFIKNISDIHYSNNKITVIKKNDFKFIVNLKNCYLNNNLLIEINPEAFKYNLLLETLYIQNNTLQEFALDLKKIKYLSILDISNNPLANIHKLFFDGYITNAQHKSSNSRELIIKNMKFECSCNMSWITLQGINSVVDYRGSTCKEPRMDAYTGIELNRVFCKLFYCEIKLQNKLKYQCKG